MRIAIDLNANLVSIQIRLSGLKNAVLHREIKINNEINKIKQRLLVKIMQ
jgi:hypothetical protein